METTLTISDFVSYENCKLLNDAGMINIPFDYEWWKGAIPNKGIAHLLVICTNDGCNREGMDELIGPAWTKQSIRAMFPKQFRKTAFLQDFDKVISRFLSLLEKGIIDPRQYEDIPF